MVSNLHAVHNKCTVDGINSPEQEPFASYTLPLDPGATAEPPQPGVFFPYTTQRNDSATIENNVAGFGVLEDIAYVKDANDVGCL
jgi:hypothetical protein